MYINSKLQEPVTRVQLQEQHSSKSGRNKFTSISTFIQMPKYLKVCMYTVRDLLLINAYPHVQTCKLEERELSAVSDYECRQCSR